jgi:hypothetical protein
MSSNSEVFSFWYQALHNNIQCIYALADGLYSLSGDIYYCVSEDDMVAHIELEFIVYEGALDTLLKHHGLKSWTNIKQNGGGNGFRTR